MLLSTRLSRRIAAFGPILAAATAARALARSPSQAVRLDGAAFAFAGAADISTSTILL